MNLLAPTYNPVFIVDPACLPTRDALAFWLTNPLLVAEHPDLVAERTEQYPGWPAPQQLGLLTRLKTRRDILRNLVAVPSDALQINELRRLIDAHETLLRDRERAYVRAFAYKLHPAEHQWYYDFLAAAFAKRKANADEQHSQAA